MVEGIPLGPYLLVRRLARGGMAEIFLARREGPEGFSRDLVVKRILPHLGADAEFVQMFLEEARIAARLAHPNVVHVYDFGEVDDQYYLAMELVRGVDLFALILRAAELARAEGKVGAVPMHHAAKILSFVCEGLAHAHGLHTAGAHKLVHRDVTPANVLISFDGAVKVADFGIAKAEQNTHIEATRQGVIKGKRTYLSPEQSRGERLDARSDLFNVGILLYEMVTGVPLFTAEGYRDAMRELMAGRLPGERWLAEVPDALVRTLRRALAPNPADRHPDALALRAELEAFLRTWPEPSDAVEIGVYVRTLFADVVAADRLAPRAAGTVPAMTAQIAPGSASGTALAAAARAPESKRAASSAARPRGPTVRMDVAGDDSDLLETAQTAVRGLPSADEDETMPPLRRAPTTAHIPITTEPSGLSLWRIAGVGIAVALLALVGTGVWLALRTTMTTPHVAVQAPLVVAPPVQGPVVQLSAARLRVSSTPAGATVSIDGIHRGETPLEVSVLPGAHDVALTLDGYSDEASAVTLAEPGETGVLVFSLRRTARIRPGGSRVPIVANAQRSGTLTISTSPWSRVYLGARLLGTTPLANVALAAGRHTLTLRAPGRPDKQAVVNITADRETRVREVM